MRHALALLVLTTLTGTVAAQPLFEPPPDYLAPEIPQTCEQPEDAHRWEFHVDYLYMFLQRLRVPPVLAAGPAGSPGRLGDPGVTVLRGGRLPSRFGRYIGVRPEIDWWADDEHSMGFQVNAFFLERDSTHFTVRQNTVPTLSIPYIDARDGSNQARIIAGRDPVLGDLSGGTRIYSRMELFGQEANALFRLADDDNFDLHWLVGGRFLQLRERLDLTSSARILPEQSTVLGLEDHFSTFNKFYGMQLGLCGEYRRGVFFLEGKAAAALGVNDQWLRMKGGSIYHVPGNRQAEPYGLFILPSNRGEHRRTAFDVVTELRLNAGVDLTGWLRCHIGYSLLTWHNTARPGDQIEPVNLTQVQPGGLTGPARPTVPWREDLFWAHGANVGLELRW